jgi:hypothetical protein
MNETLLKHGVSENIHWGAASTPRPSQFEDEEDGERRSRSKSAKRRNATNDDTATDPDPATPGLTAAPTAAAAAAAAATPPPQVLIFTDPELYSIWRAVFPSPREPPARTKIKWSDLRRALTSPPLNFTEERIVGVECKFKREAMDGYAEGMVPLHQPHGRDAWLEKELLWVTRGPFRHTFGWEAECFAFEGA